MPANIVSQLLEGGEIVVVKWGGVSRFVGIWRPKSDSGDHAARFIGEVKGCGHHVHRDKAELLVDSTGSPTGC